MCRACGSYLVTALGNRYEVRVADDGSVIGLWRRSFC